MTASLLLPALADARDFGHVAGQPRGGYGQRAWGQGPTRGGYAPPGYMGPSRAFVAPGPAYRAYPGPAYPMGGAPIRWRRGQRLPQAYRDAIISNYAYYHLRRPPPGYYWYRTNDDFVLAALGSGLIFEVISAEGY
jgi:hypothetical protein